MKLIRAITIYGRWILAAAGVLLVIGVLGGWLELVAIAAALLAMAVVSTLMVLGGHSYEVDLQLRKDRVVAGDRAMVIISVKNKTNHRIRPAVMEVPVKDAMHRTILPAIAVGGEHEEIISIQTSARAVMPIGPVRTVRGDPLGILARRVKRTDVATLSVHPRTVHVSAGLIGAAHDLDGSESNEMADSDLNFHALREYETGDDRRSIHWKSSAKGRGLLVKQYTMSQRTAILIRIDHDRANFADVAEQEEAVSLAASLGLSVLRGGGTVQVMWQETYLPSASPTMLLDSLAGIEFDVPAPFHSRRATSQSGMAFVMTGSVASFDAVRALGRLMPPTQVKVAIRVGYKSELRRTAVRGFILVDGVNLQNLRHTLALVAR